MATAYIEGHNRMAGNGQSFEPIRSCDRVALVGATGSGKTYLAVRYLSRFPQVIAADPKGMLKPGEFGVVKPYTDLRSLRDKYRGGHAIYRPSWLWRRSPEMWDRLAWYCFVIGNVIYYIDETRVVTGDSTDPPEGLSAVVQMGRERNVGCWIATQRPKRIPLNLLSECDHFFAFHLGHPADRALMAELMETTAVREVIPDKHGFWFWQAGMRGGARYFSGLRAKG